MQWLLPNLLPPCGLPRRSLLRHGESRKAIIDPRSSSRALRFETLDDRRMLSGMHSADVPQQPGVEPLVALGTAATDWIDAEKDPVTSAVENASSRTSDAATIQDRQNPLIAVLDDTLREIDGHVREIRALVESVIDADLSQDQVSATQLLIDSHSEIIDRMAQAAKFQGVPLLSGLLGIGTDGLLLDVGHRNPFADPTRIYIPALSTTTLRGPDGRLFQIRSGGDFDLDTDAHKALAVTGQVLEQLHGIRAYFGWFSEYHGADAVLIPEMDTGGYRLTEIRSDELVGIASLAEAERVIVSPDDTFVCLDGFENDSTVVFRLNTTGDRLTFLETLRVAETQRENPLLARATDGLVDIRAAVEEVVSIVSAVIEGNQPGDDYIDEQQARIDRLIEEIGEIARTTSYEGTPLLDGGLDILAENVDDSLIHDLRIFQAALCGNDSLDVHVNVAEPATRAMLFYEGGTLEDGIVLEIGGDLGYKACNFAEGTPVEDIAATINLLSQSLGVEAVVEDGATLVFLSAGFGSAEFVSVRSLEGSFTTTDSNGDVTRRQYGSDAKVIINGLAAEARGFDVALNTAALDLRFTLDVDIPGATESNFQVANSTLQYLSAVQDGSRQYTCLGIPGLTPDDLGGTGGRLGDLYSTGSASLDGAPEAALAIVSNVVEQVRRLEVRMNVLAQGESAVSVRVADESGGWTEIDAQPDSDPSKRTTPLLAAADNGLASIGVMLREVQDIATETANQYYYNDPLEGELQQLRVDMLLQAIQRTAATAAVESIAPLDGRFRLTPLGPAVNQLRNVEINHVDFDGQIPFGVNVRVVEQATRGRLIYPHYSVDSDTILKIGGPDGTEYYHFADGSTIAEMASALNLMSDWLGVTATVQGGSYAQEDTAGSVTLTSVGANNDIIVTADTPGRVGGDIDIIYNSTPGGLIGSTVTTNADGSISIEVNLATTDWNAASGTAISLGGPGSIDLAARAAGSLFNGVDIEIFDSPTGNSAIYDHANKLITVALDTTGGDDSSDVADTINNDLSHLFVCAVNNDGPVVSGTYADVLTFGIDGRIITSTAADVIQELNVTNANTAALVTAAAGEASAIGVVTTFTDRAYHGTPNTGGGDDANNYLQFLGPDASSDLNFRFIAAGANQSLSIDLVANSQTAGFATGVVQSSASDASFTITAKTPGEAYSDVAVLFDDDSGSHATDPAVVAWDPQYKTITITGDFSNAAFTATELCGVINNDTVVGQYFTATVFGPGIGSGLVDLPVADGCLSMGTLTGGNQYTGVTVNLATDANGAITTTAADLVDYINAGGTGLDTLGISVSHTGGSTGTGLLEAGTMAFGSENTTASEGYATTTTNNAGGIRSQLTITAKTPGAAYDNVKVNFHHDYGVTAGIDEYVTYNPGTRELNIHIEIGVSTVRDVLNRLGDPASAYAAALFSFTPVQYGTDVLHAADIGGVTSDGLVVDTSAQTGVHMLGNHDKGDILGSPALVISSIAYGSDAFVSVEALEGIFDMLDEDGNVATRAAGADAEVFVNDMRAVCNGLSVGLYSPSLALSFSLDAAASPGEMHFVIPHGGVQLDPSPDAPSGSIPVLGIIDASSLGMEGVDDGISIAIRQRARLAIFERDVMGITGPADQPPTTSGIDDVVVNEGVAHTSVDLFSAFEDDRDANADLTYCIVENTNPGIFDAIVVDASSGKLMLNHALDDGTTQITVKATDSSGQSVTATFHATVENVAPLIVGIEMRDTVVRCQTLEYAASVFDIGIADTHVVSIDWGDGSPVETAEVNENGCAGTISGSHEYATAGVYTVVVTLEDDDGGSTTARNQVTVKTTAVLDDPYRPGQRALYVGGTPGDDGIFISRFRNMFVSVFIAPENYWRLFALRNDRQVYVYAGEGNDVVNIFADNRFHALVFGGPGNDRLYGGRGNDILIGGQGNDHLYGNSGNDILLGGAGRDILFGDKGRDILIGGPGSDCLAGSDGDDILIGGTTSHDSNRVALAAVLAEWTSSEPVNIRIDHLRNGGGLNGRFRLKIHETVFDDGKIDLLWGGWGRDWIM